MKIKSTLSSILLGSILFTAQAFDGNGELWHDWFAPNGETPLMGDFNNDGKDDIVTFTKGQGADVYVAINSNGQRFAGHSWKWHNYFSPWDEVPLVGDFNGDGKDDIVTFTNDHTGDVWVSLSNSSSFQGASRWHHWFAPNGETPRVGDFNGDGKDDIITFTKNSTNDIYVAYSNGNAFVNVKKINVGTVINDFIPFIGDFNGDGKDDILIGSEYSSEIMGFHISLSTGNSFAPLNNTSRLAINRSSYNEETADMDNDGKDDFIYITQNNDIRVLYGNGNTLTTTEEIGILDTSNNYGVLKYADVNDDGKTDLINFTNDAWGDVIVDLKN